jgi:multicomponent Na+:H+ antiporter subunit F
MDILGTILVGFCALMTVITDQDWYLNIAISWALLSFVGTLAVAKFIEGRGLHE